MNIQEQKNLAARLLEITDAEVEVSSVFLSDVEALFVTVPTKDGESLFVAKDGSVLYGDSSLSFHELLIMFNDGERTPLSFFGV